MDNPNFTVITSGGCNAKCDFCTDPMNYRASDDYIPNLMKVVNELPSNFNQVSVSGGEPTISPDLEAVLLILRMSGRFKKTVLTTNGTFLHKHLKTISRYVDHLNVSRHGVGYDRNAEVFKNKQIPKDASLVDSFRELNKNGVDVNLNWVYCKGDQISFEDVVDYVDYAKSLGANCVTFRYDQANNSLDLTDLEMLFSDYKRVREGGCPVCRNHTILLNGFPVTFKASFEEPSNTIGDMYELIYHPSGKLTTDWEGKNEYKTAPTAKPLHIAQAVYRDVSLGGGCGGGGCGK